MQFSLQSGDELQRRQGIYGVVDDEQPVPDSRAPGSTPAIKRTHREAQGGEEEREMSTHWAAKAAGLTSR